LASPQRDRTPPPPTIEDDIPVADHRHPDAARGKAEGVKVRIEHLARHPEALARLAAWHHAEWGFLHPGGTATEVAEELRGHLEPGRIPTTFVALLGQEVVGSASLVEDDLPERPDLGPWLASLYVAPAHRRQGIGAALAERVVEEAARLGVPTLYLFTFDQEDYYAGLGWQRRDLETCQGHPVVVMTRDLRTAWSRSAGPTPEAS
jgi:predicted N-acetyltransferase YhbS